ncbi:hypothetical protein BG004_004944 [Podila humilis]|nr:hypothetical protein BG004_004944 [Podila humilis]
MFELVLSGLDDFSGFLDRFLPWMHHITVLRMDDLTTGAFPLDKLLAHCPYLEQLHLHGLMKPKGGNHPLVDFPHRVEYFSCSGENNEHKDLLMRMGSYSTMQPRNPLRLRALRLETVWIREQSLFSLLDICPDLYKLHVQVPSIYSGTHRELGDGLVLLDNVKFFEDFAARYPRVTSLQFAIGPNLMPLELTCAMVDSLRPQALEWIMIRRDLKRPVFERLVSTGIPLCSSMLSNSPASYVRPILTSLTIVYSPVFEQLDEDYTSIHHFLCLLPTLVHLDAYSVPYLIDFLDLNRILTTSANLDSFLNTPPMRRASAPEFDPILKVWACRGLKTLKLTFRTLRDHYDSYPETGIKQKRSTDELLFASRIVYGYLARFCPNIEDLSIGYAYLNLTLQGGFCLLTQLERLRRLHIGSFGAAYNRFSAIDIELWAIKGKYPFPKSKRRSIEAKIRSLLPVMSREGLVGHFMRQGNEDLEGVGSAFDVDIHELGHASDTRNVLEMLLAKITKTTAGGRETAAVSSQGSKSVTPSTSPGAAMWGKNDGPPQHVWPDLEAMSMEYQRKLIEKKDFVRLLLRHHRPEVKFERIDWYSMHHRRHSPYRSN